MNGDIPPLHLDQLIQLLKTWLNGHECQSELCLIESLTHSALFWIQHKKKLDSSPELDRLQLEFVSVKNIHLRTRKFQQTSEKKDAKSHSNSARPKRTNIKKLLIVFKNLSWIPSPDVLNDLFEYCRMMDYVRCDFTEFKIHFFGSLTHVKKIIWYGTSKELGRLFSKLKKAGIIKGSYLFQILPMHFVLPDNVQLNSDSLSSSSSYVVPNGVDASMDTIVRKIRETIR